MEIGGGVRNETINIDKFFHDVENVKDDMTVVENLYKKIQESNEESKMVHNVGQMKLLRSKMDSDFTHLLKIMKIIKGKLEALDKSNVEHRKIPGCGTGSSFDRTCTSVVIGLCKKLKIMMDDFQKLQAQISDDHKKGIARRYFTITGENANDDLINKLISSGNDKDFLKIRIHDQCREQTKDIILEIQERHDAIIEIKKNLTELRQIFLDMVILVETQGNQPNDIESHLAHTIFFVRLETDQTVEANNLQRRWRKCAWITVIFIVMVVIIILICFVVLPIILEDY